MKTTNAQNFGESSNRSSNDTNDPTTRSLDVNNRNWMNRRPTSVINPIKEMEKDGDDDNENNSNTFAPALSNLSNNSRVILVL